MNNSNYIIRKSQSSDLAEIFSLYKRVAEIPGGLARGADEITMNYIQHFSEKAKAKGIQLVIEETSTKKIIAELHCYSPDPKAFAHVLSDLTVAVDPQHQGKGLGKQLFEELLKVVQTEMKHICRIELIARESNSRALELYEKIGFRREGRMEGRIMNANGAYEADIPMAWTRA